MREKGDSRQRCRKSLNILSESRFLSRNSLACEKRKRTIKGRKEMEKEIGKENHKRTVNERSKKNHNQVEAYILDSRTSKNDGHNGSTDVSTTPLFGVLDTNHHVSHVCIN